MERKVYVLIAIVILIGLLPATALAAQTGEGTADPELIAPDTIDTSAAASTIGIAYGAHVRPVFINHGDGTWYSYGDEIMAMNKLVGKDLSVVMYFASWSPFDSFLVDEIQRVVPQDRRPVIMLTWEPSVVSSGCDLGFGDGQGPLRSINSGRCDDYIRSYAQALKGRSERFILRLAHEMNVTSSQWWPGRWGLDARAYTEMFRRVHAIFEAVGTPNVEFMWSPNNASNPPDAWNNIHNYYPGDDAVDWIGLSGYNWYTWQSQPWSGFEAIYQDILPDLACRYAKPVIIAEVATVDGPSGASRPAWITHTYEELAKYPFVRGILWFNDFAYADRSQADFRVTTGGQDCQATGGCSGVQALPGAGSQTTNAFINAVQQKTYTSKLPSLAEATPPFTLCAAPSSQFSLDSNTVTTWPGGTAGVKVRGFLFSSNTQVTYQMPAGLHITLSNATMTPPWGTATINVTADSKMAPGVYQGTIRAGNTNLSLTVKVYQVRTYLPSVGK